MMLKHSHFVLLSGILLFVLFLGLARPMTVLAQDDTPPPDGMEEATQPSDDGSGVSLLATDELEDIATGETLQPPTEVPVVIGTPVTTEAPATTATGMPIADSEIAESSGDVNVNEVLETALEDTVIVVLDENGELLPLVSEEAAEIINIADPIWCPTGQVPGDPGCTTSYATVTELVADLHTRSGAGTIYFTSSYSAADAIFDHNYLSNLTDLTIQGGWNGVSGPGYGLSGVTMFNTQLRVNTWSGNVTIKNVTINGTTGVGLTIDTKGDINIDHVTSNNNGFTGAILDNCILGWNGVTWKCTGTGNVNVSSSTFGDYDDNNTSDVTDDVSYGNGGAGLDVSSVGNITLTDVIARGNYYSGAALKNGWNTGDVWITGGNFDWNTGNGVTIISSGGVFLNNVSASNNGARVSQGPSDANGVNVVAFQGDVTITCSELVRNNDFGTKVFVPNGTLTLDDVSLSGNGDGEYRYDNGTLVIKSGGCNGKVKNQSSKLSVSNSSANLGFHIVQADAGEQIVLDCSTFVGTELMLPNGNKVILHCPLLGEAVLTGQTQAQLPGVLTSQYTFLSALSIQVSRDGQMIKTATPALTIDFVIPSHQQSADFAILRWGEEQSQWVEVPGTKTSDGHFLANSKFTGTYVLVTR